MEKKYIDQVDDYRNAISIMYQQGIMAPNIVLAELLKMYKPDTADLSRFFSADETKDTKKFIDQTIDELQDASSDSKLSQVIKDIDTDLSNSGNFQHYDVHAKFHTLWIAFFECYPNLFNPQTVDVALEENPDNPALPTQEERTQSPSILKNSWMKARLLQQKNTFQELSEELAKMKEARSLDGHYWVSMESKDTIIDIMVSHVAQEDLVVVFKSMSDLIPFCNQFNHFSLFKTLYGIITMLSEEERKDAINALTADVEDVMDIRPHVLINLISLDPEPSQQHLDIAYNNMMKLFEIDSDTWIQHLINYDRFRDTVEDKDSPYHNLIAKIIRNLTQDQLAAFYDKLESEPDGYRFVHFFSHLPVEYQEKSLDALISKTINASAYVDLSLSTAPGNPF